MYAFPASYGMEENGTEAPQPEQDAEPGARAAHQGRRTRKLPQHRRRGIVTLRNEPRLRTGAETVVAGMHLWKARQRMNLGRRQRQGAKAVRHQHHYQLPAENMVTPSLRALTLYDLMAMTRYMPPREVLHRLTRTAFDVSDEPEADLPDSELVSAIHQFVCDYFNARGYMPQAQCMFDETSLLAFAVYVEEYMRAYVGGAQRAFASDPYTETPPERGAESQPRRAVADSTPILIPDRKTHVSEPAAPPAATASVDTDTDPDTPTDSSEGY